MTAPTLSTSIGDFTLHEYRLRLGERTFSFLHTGSVVTLDDERRYLAQEEGRVPYGAMLWPASIALAHDLAARGAALRGARVLELGAGTGLPGIVAAALGAHVLQIDRSEVALHLCTSNAARNGVALEAREAEWETFHSEHVFDLILGADVLYVTPMHARLQQICERYLAPTGSALFADPFRAQSLPMLEAMEAATFSVSLSKWTISVPGGTRAIAIYEAQRRTRDLEPAE